MTIKKIAALATAVVLACSMAACSKDAPATTGSKLTDGTYSSTVMSVGGPLTVEVTVAGDKLEKVEVTEINDTPGIYNPVVERYTEMMVANQSINIDALSGATLSSMFIKTAVKDALSQAGDVSDFNTKVEIKAEAHEDMECDVVVIGAGMAGMNAAHRLAALGYDTVLLEELSYLGGNAIESDQFAIRSGGSKWNEFRDFLVGEVPAIGVGSYWGMDRFMPGEETNTSVMDFIISHIEEDLVKKGVKIMKQTPATDLIIENGEVKGVVAAPRNQDSFKITAKATVVANGGFQGNKELVREHLPFAKDAMLVGPSKGRGEIFTWLKDFDVATRDMDWHLAMFYAVDPQTGFYADWGTLPTNFLDKEGNLITEDNNYNSGAMHTYEAVGHDTFYTVYAKSDVEANGEMEIIDWMLLADSTVKCTMAELADKMGMANAAETLKKLGYTEEDTYFVCEAKSGIYGTMGGIAVNENYQVVLTNGDVIPGVFATSETIGRNYGGSVGGAMCYGYEAAEGVKAILG